MTCSLAILQDNAQLVGFQGGTCVALFPRRVQSPRMEPSLLKHLTSCRGPYPHAVLSPQLSSSY